MNGFTFYFLILIAVVVVNRMIAERALKSLSADDKARLFDSFSGYRQYNTYLLLGLVAMYLVTTNYLPHFYGPLTLIYIGLYFAVSIVLTIVGYKKLKDLHMPATYIQSYWMRMAIQFAGISAIFIPIAWNAFTFSID